MANDSISASLLNKLGLTGTGVSSNLIPRPDNEKTRDNLWSDFQDRGKIANVELWTRYGSMMKRPVTFDSMIQLWEEMAGWDLMAAALVEIVDEATQKDEHSPATIWYECNDVGFEEELNDMLLRLDVESLLPSQVWYTAGLGNSFEKLDYAQNEGVLGMTFVHPFDVRRYWLQRNRRCIGFRWEGNKPKDKDDAFTDAEGHPIERISIGDSQNIDNLWYPWDFLHFRRMYRLRMSEHGEPVFDEAQGIYKKLRLALDQMVVHRAQVQPDRYQINIDVQDQPPMEQMRTVQRWKQSLRSKLSFGSSNDPSGDPAAFFSYYNSMSLDTILWVAKPKGFTHGIEKIAGTANVPDVYDIEMLTNLFFAIIGMPKSWIGIGNPAAGGEGGGPASGKALLAQDMRFLRKIKSIRRPIINGYTWLGYFHALLKGKDLKELDLQAKMPPIGSLEDQMRMETLKLQSEVMTAMGDVMEKYGLPKQQWIEIMFKRYIHLPDDIVNTLITSLPSETPQEEGVRRSSPSTARILEEIEKNLGPRSTLLRDFSAVIEGKKPILNENRVWRKLNGVASMPDITENDLVFSSFGKDPLKARRLSGQQTQQPRPIQENKEAPWRQYMKFD